MEVISEKKLPLEEKILVRLKGQGFPQILWSGQDKENFYLIMERLGRDLSFLINQYGSLCMTSVVSIALQLVRRLEKLHQTGYLHRYGSIRINLKVVLLHISLSWCYLLVCHYNLQRFETWERFLWKRWLTWYHSFNRFWTTPKSCCQRWIWWQRWLLWNNRLRLLPGNEGGNANVSRFTYTEETSRGPPSYNERK